MLSFALPLAAVLVVQVAVLVPVADFLTRKLAGESVSRHGTPAAAHLPTAA